MLRNELVTRAYYRLLERFGSDRERTAVSRNQPHEMPPESELISRAVREAALDPSAGTAHLRAALELTGRDQEQAEGREINVVNLLREQGVTWREIAFHRGLESAQAAQQRFQRQTKPPEVMIYAFRDKGESDAAWHGDADALPDSEFQSGLLDFNPAFPRPLSGRTLEVRYGPVDAEPMPAYLRAYALVNGRRIAPTAAVHKELFGD